MAERHLSGKKLLLFRGTGTGTPETFALVACLTSNDINQTSTTISTDTKCGVIKLPGTQDATVPFAFIPFLDPATGKVAITTLQDDYKNGTISNWKASTAPVDDDAAAGDPIFSFKGFITELSWKAGSNDPFNGTGTIQVDDAGVTLTLAT